MRQSNVFVLTLLVDEADPADLRGSVRHVATDQEALFIGAEELRRILFEAIQGDIHNHKSDTGSHSEEHS